MLFYLERLKLRKGCEGNPDPSSLVNASLGDMYRADIRLRNVDCRVLRLANLHIYNVLH